MAFHGTAGFGPEHRRTRLLEHLRPGRVIAHRGAALLGVSVRTIYRDIRTLQRQGYAVRALTGPQGGFWLDAGCRPVPLSLSESDLHEVVLAVVRSAHAGALTTTSDPAALLQRLLAGFPQQRVEFIQSAPEEHHQRRWVLTLERGRGPRNTVYALEPDQLVLDEGQWAITGRESRSRKVQRIPLQRIVSGRLRLQRCLDLERPRVWSGPTRRRPALAPGL